MISYSVRSLVDVCGTVEQLRQDALTKLNDVAMPFAVQEYTHERNNALTEGLTLAATKNGEELWLYNRGERPINQPQKRLYLVIGSSFARNINRAVPKLVFDKQDPCSLKFECLAGSGELACLELVAGHPAEKAIGKMFPRSEQHNHNILYAESNTGIYTFRLDFMEIVDNTLTKAGIQISAITMEQDLVELTKQNLRARI